jgi:hypothetical protein
MHMQMGQYQLIMTATNPITAPGATLFFVGTGVIELGADGSDTLVATGIHKVDSGTSKPIGDELAITGGTGKYLGAVGDAFLKADTKTVTLNVYVPKL